MSYFRLLHVILLCVLIPRAVLTQNTKENADFKLAINLYNDGLYDLAEEQLKQFINSYPNTSQGVDARFTLGLTELKLRKYEEARLTFQTFALTYQDNLKAPDAWWNVGEAFAALKSYKDAALAFERVKVFHPNSRSAAEALVQAAAYFELAGERDNARRVLRVVLQEYPATSAATSARTRLAQIYFAEGNLDQARNELTRVIEGDPSPEAKAQALLLLGQIHRAMGRMDQAESSYQEIVTRYKTTSAVRGAHVFLGGLFAASGRHQAALDEYRRALNDKGPLDSALIRDAMVGMGDAERSSGDLKEAMAAYDRFLSTYPLDPRAPEVLWKLAVTAAGAKAHRRSNDACSRILASEAPDILKRRALVRLARNADQQKNFAAAVQHYTAFVQAYPDDRATAGLVLAAALITEKDLNDHRKAAAAYELLGSRFPASAVADDALAGAARCHEQLKEFERALQEYRELTSKFPASEHRTEAEQRIEWITLFEIKEKDSGLEKLAMLVGDVVADRDKAGLAFRLGEIYYADLKNYEAGATQFAAALASGLDGPRRNDALYLRARAFENLSRRDRAYTARAIEAYEEFLSAAPSDSRAADAALRLFTARTTSFVAAQSAADSLLMQFPDFSGKDALFLRLGRLARKADSVSAALRYFTLVRESFPDSPLAEPAWFEAFELYHTIGRLDSAMRTGIRYAGEHPRGRYSASILSLTIPIMLDSLELERAAELAADLHENYSYASAAAGARAMQAAALARGLHWDQAITIYRRLLAEQESDALTEGEISTELLSDLGTALHATGESAQAKKFFLQFLGRKQTGEDAGHVLTMLGIIARSEGQAELANAYFRQALTVAPQTSASEEIAAILFDSGAYEDALQQYLLLARNAPAEPQRRLFESRVILCRFRNDDSKAAEQAAAAFARAYPDADEEFAAFEVERGTSHFRQGSYEVALKSFDRVIGKYGNTESVAAAMYWRGKSLQAMAKPKEAIEQFNLLLADYPGSAMSARTHMALGNVFYGLEKWDEAIRHYRAVVDDSTSDATLVPMAMSNLIETYEIAGLNDAALSLTRRYLDLFPNNQDAFDKQIKIGILYQRLGYYDQAVLHLQSLLDDAGSDLEGEIRYYIAEANYAKGDYQQAILDFLKVPYLVTKKGKIDWTATSLYMAGQSYEKLTRYDQALLMYQQIIDRPGIDGTFKAAARKELDRVKLVLKKKGN